MMGVQCHVIGGCGKLRPNFCERQEQMEQLNTLSHYNSQLSGHRSIENVGKHNIRLQLNHAQTLCIIWSMQKRASLFSFFLR